jgi:hypothetical protein
MRCHIPIDELRTLQATAPANVVSADGARSWDGAGS